jgi:hypothetical protein
MNPVIRRIAGYSLFVVGIVSGFCALLMTPLYISGGLELEALSGEPLIVLGVVHWLLTVVLVRLGVFLASEMRATDEVPAGPKRLLGFLLLLASLYSGYLLFLVLIYVSVRWHVPTAYALLTLFFVIGAVRCLGKGRIRRPAGPPR